MVKKVRKEMPKQKGEKVQTKKSIQSFINRKPTNFKMKKEKNRY